MLSLFDKKRMEQQKDDMKFLPQLLWWVVVPFIPLYLSLPYPTLFYLILAGYLVLFFIMNYFIMRYPLIDVFVLLLLFLFCVFIVKSLSNEGVIEGKEIVRTGLEIGIL